MAENWLLGKDLGLPRVATGMTTLAFGCPVLSVSPTLNPDWPLFVLALDLIYTWLYTSLDLAHHHTLKT